MLPFARFVFNWEMMGDKYYNVVDSRGTVYQDGSTISGKTVDSLGLPIVKSAEDEEEILKQTNEAYFQMHMSSFGAR